MSWVFDRFTAIPYLRAIGQFSSGKSRYIEVVGSICYRALFGSGASSPASLYRAISAFNGPTLILDEADFAKSAEAHEITKILNQGYQRKGGVMKSERGDDDEGSFEVNDLPDVLAEGPRDPRLLRGPGPRIPLLQLHDADPPARSRARSRSASGGSSTRTRSGSGTCWCSGASATGVLVTVGRTGPASRASREARINQIVQPIAACTKDPALQRDDHRGRAPVLGGDAPAAPGVHRGHGRRRAPAAVGTREPHRPHEPAVDARPLLRGDEDEDDPRRFSGHRPRRT